MERWSLTENSVSRSTSSPHRSMRTGRVGGGREHVDDRAAHGDLAAVLDLATRAGSRRRRAGRPARRGRAARPGATTSGSTSSTCGPSRCTRARTGGHHDPRAPARGSRRRHRVRRRRPMVSTTGLTRSKGRVSQAGNSVDRVGPEEACAGRVARRSASAVVGVATTIGRRGLSVAPGRRRRGRGPARARPGPRTSGRARTRSRAPRAAAGGGHGAPSRRACPRYRRAYSASGRRVDVVHGHVGALGQDQLDRVGRLLDHALSSRCVGLAGPLQHVVDAPGLPGGLADADAHPDEVVGVQVGLHRLEAVVAGQPAADLHLDPPTGRSSSSWTITSRWGSSMPWRRASGATACPEVHEGRRARPGPGAGRRRRPRRRAPSPWAPQPAAVAVGQQLDDLGPDVVAGAGVLRARGCRGRRPAGRPGCPADRRRPAAGRASALVAARGAAVAAAASPSRGRVVATPRRPRPRHPRLAVALDRLGDLDLVAMPGGRRRPAPRGRPRW